MKMFFFFNFKSKIIIVQRALGQDFVSTRVCLLKIFYFVCISMHSNAYSQHIGSKEINIYSRTFSRS